jgi:hypothetical protein
MDKKFKLPALFCLLLLTGCSKYYLSLRQVPVDATYLASTQVNTPDPRRDNPPYGQKIVLEWAVPPELLKKKPQIIFHVIYKNHTEKTFVYPIGSRLGTKVYSLLDNDYDETGGVLTYSAEIMTPDHQVYRTWKHQLWVNLINLDEEKTGEQP